MYKRQNHDLAEKDYVAPKKVSKITERINHIQDSRPDPHDSSDDDAKKPHAQTTTTAHADRDEELHYTDVRSRRSQQQYQRRGYSSDRRGRRDNSTPATQVKKRSYNDLLIMLHPLLDRAGNSKRSTAEKEAEDKKKDSDEEKAENPAAFEWPKDDDLPLEEAADFWKDVVDGMAQFEIDVERQYRIDNAKAEAERDARLKKAASQKQEFMTRFRNTDKYKELIAQRKDAAHAYKAEVDRHFRTARRTMPSQSPPTFKQFAHATHHPSLNIPPSVTPPQEYRNRYTHPNQEASQSRRYCKRCGWRELPRICLLYTSPSPRD